VAESPTSLLSPIGTKDGLEGLVVSSGPIGLGTISTGKGSVLSATSGWTVDHSEDRWESEDAGCKRVAKIASNVNVVAPGSKNRIVASEGVALFNGWVPTGSEEKLGGLKG
jgi:hypothetical protein